MPNLKITRTRIHTYVFLNINSFYLKNINFFFNLLYKKLCIDLILYYELYLKLLQLCLHIGIL